MESTNTKTVTVNSNTANSTKVCDDGRTLSTMAQEVLLGQWGNNPNRQNDLTAAGCDYSTIQAYVNQLVETGQASYGTGVTVEKPKVEIEVEEDSKTVITPVEEEDEEKEQEEVVEEKEEEKEEEETEEEVTTIGQTSTTTTTPTNNRTDYTPIIGIGVGLIFILIIAIVVIYKKFGHKPIAEEHQELHSRPLTFDKETRTFHESTEEELREQAAEEEYERRQANEFDDEPDEPVDDEDITIIDRNNQDPEE